MKNMKIFITGTDTDIGKTTVCSWLCLHSGYSYFKPIQTGSIEGTDSEKVFSLTKSRIYKESYIYKTPVSPHLAASVENDRIDLRNIQLPNVNNLIVEGAGGLLVPINENDFLIDLIKKLNIPVILVARPNLGTINHTLLSIQAMRSQNIEIMGVILNGGYNKDNIDAIEHHGKVRVLASIPKLRQINRNTLLEIPLTKSLKYIFGIERCDSDSICLKPNMNTEQIKVANPVGQNFPL